MALEAISTSVVTVQDLNPFEGKANAITGIEEKEVNSTYNERGKQMVLKVSGTSVNVNGMDITPSELFNLKEDANGTVIGYSTQGGLQQFMDKLGAKTPEDLVGKEAKLRVQPGRDGDIGFLSFIK